MKVNPDIKERQKIYNNWHKKLYQPNISIRIRKKQFNQLYRIVTKHLEIDKDTEGKLLDIACGKGLFLLGLRDINKKIKLYGSDISDYAIKIAKTIVDATFFTEDGENLSSKKNQFDYVTCLGGLEYYKDPAGGAREISRVLKKNGKAVIFVPNLMFLGYIWLALRCGMMPSHGGSTSDGKNIYDYNSEKFYTHKGWEDILNKGGLEIEDSLSFNFIGRTKFAGKFISFFYNNFFRKFVPFNLAYCFIFICRKK